MTNPICPSSIADQLVRQFDSVWVFLISLVLFGKNLFQPLCLFLCNPLIHPRGIVAYEELFAATLEFTVGMTCSP